MTTDNTHKQPAQQETEPMTSPAAQGHPPSGKKAGWLSMVGRTIGKWRGDPKLMLEEVENNLEVNQRKMEQHARKADELYARICSRKAEYEKAPPARKRSLEPELKSLISQHKSMDGIIHVLHENNLKLCKMRDKLNEGLAYKEAGIATRDIDRLNDKMTELVQDADYQAEAIRDLEHGAERTSFLTDDVSLDDELEGYGEQTNASEMDSLLAGYGEPERTETPTRKTAEGTTQTKPERSSEPQ